MFFGMCYSVLRKLQLPCASIFECIFMSVSSSTRGFVALCVSFFNGVIQQIQSISNVNDWCISCEGVGCTQHTRGILMGRFCPKVQHLSKTTILHVHHAFLYISFLFLHDFDVKMPNFAFYGGRKQATTKFYFSF